MEVTFITNNYDYKHMYESFIINSVIFHEKKSIFKKNCLNLDSVVVCILIFNLH